MNALKLTRTATKLMREAGAAGPNAALIAVRQGGEVVLLVGQLARLDEVARRQPAGGAAELRAALAQHGGNVSQVARALGITRRTVYLRMDRYRIARRTGRDARKRR